MRHATIKSSTSRSDKIRAVQALRHAATDFVRARAPTVYSRELVDVLFVQPYCRIQNLVQAGVAKRETASVYLRKLVEIGMLSEIKVGRDKLFLHSNFARF